MAEQGRRAELDPALALGRRRGLPDALRALLETHPRSSWTAPGRLGPLAGFWLERHLMFREILARLIEEAEAHIDARSDAQRFAVVVARLGRLFAGELHGHHQIEDAHYFPALAARETRLVRAFDILDADHQALDAHLAAFVDGANTALRAIAAQSPAPDASGAFLATLKRFEPFLDRHLVDEEEVIVPILLEHGEELLG